MKSTDRQEELRSCLYCGGEVSDGFLDENWGYLACCNSCGAMMSGESPEKVIKALNTRPTAANKSMADTELRDNLDMEKAAVDTLQGEARELREALGGAVKELEELKVGFKFGTNRSGLFYFKRVFTGFLVVAEKIDSRIAKLTKLLND